MRLALEIIAVILGIYLFVVSLIRVILVIFFLQENPFCRTFGHRWRWPDGVDMGGTPKTNQCKFCGWIDRTWQKGKKCSTAEEREKYKKNREYEDKKYWQQWPKSNKFLNSWWIDGIFFLIFGASILLSIWSYNTLKIIALILLVDVCITMHYNAQIKI